MNNKHSNSTFNTECRNTTLVPSKPQGLLAHLFVEFMELLINIPVMNAVWRERRELELFSDEQMKDIGLDPNTVRWEAKRGFFDIPETRRRCLGSAKKEYYGRFY